MLGALGKSCGFGDYLAPDPIREMIEMTGIVHNVSRRQEN